MSIGAYEKLELIYLRYNMVDKTGNFYPDGEPDLGSYSDLAVGLTFGTRRVVSQNFLVNLGIQFAYATGFFQDQVSPEEIYLKDLSSSMLKGHFAVNLNVGFGWLMF